MMGHDMSRICERRQNWKHVSTMYMLCCKPNLVESEAELLVCLYAWELMCCRLCEHKETLSYGNPLVL